MLVFPTVIVAFLQFSFVDGLISRSSGLRVTLAIFSGRRDPVWSIPAVGDINRLLGAARIHGFAYNITDMPARLGFKGFVVQERKNAQLFVGRETTELQLRLLQTMPKDLLKSGTRQKIQNAINFGAVKFEAKEGSSKYKRYAPLYNPDPWHASEMVLRCNNCYNYANIIIANNVALPGSGSGQVYEEPMTEQSVQDAAVRDGLQVLIPQPTAADPAPGPPAGSRHLVALVVDQGTVNYDGDFHWYRLDSDGKWSHKPGECHVEREDDAGDEITDPRLAAMGDYRFLSFMTSDKNTVAITDNFQCPYIY